ncbi:hypothetical protein [Allofournierella sp.]|uniref:hypothetical protein n=1 Tax=Allofournierella sp. TaxID=1940256 RepID=UPI003AB1FA21
MKHAKKLIALVLCMVLALGLGLSAYADFGEILYPKTRWSNVSVVTGGVDSKELSGGVVLYNSNHYVTINVTLQKYNSGWKDTSVVTSDEGYKLASASTSVNLSAGSYRAKIVFRVYTTKGGAYLEGDTVYSGEYLV